METVYEILEKFLRSHSFKTKNSKEIYKIFLSYIYLSLESPTKNKNKNKKENKYIQIRKQLLNAITANEQQMIATIRKKYEKIF
jgi:hypothetical protein